MRETFARGVLALSLATLFVMGGSSGAFASAGGTSVESTASGTAAGSPRPVVAAVALATPGSHTAPTPATHALGSSGLDASTLLGFWVGGGALALATAAILVRVTVRQARKESKAAE